MTSPAPSPRRAAALFVAAWVAPPLLARAATLAGRVDLASAGAGLFMGLLGDVAVLAQAVALLLLARKLVGRGWILPGWLLTTAVGLYVLIDLLMVLVIDLRMHYGFVHLVGDARLFADSVTPAGKGLLVAVVVGSAVGAGLLVWRLAQPLTTLRPTRRWLVLGAAAGLGVLAQAAGPPALMYWAGNPVLADELALLRRAVGPDDALVRLAREADGPEPAVAVRVGEVASGDTDPAAPLWRRTTGFTGPTRFDIRVDPGERPHVVILMLESFRGVDVGALGGPHGVTPVFDQLASEGVLFTDFYACGVQSSRALIATLFGVLPRMDAWAAHQARPALPLIGLADVLTGYHSAFVHNGEAAFENRGAFLRHQRYDELHFVDQVAAAFENPVGTSWGIHDEYLMRYAADWLGRQARPTFATVFTVSNHHPWTLPTSFTAPEIDVPGDTHYGKYLRTIAYADHCLGQFMKRLRDTGLARKTILLVLADTAQVFGERDGNIWVTRNLFEEHVRLPLLIVADGRIKAPARVSDPASQVDIMPTLMDVLGVTGQHHGVGESLRRANPERMAFFNSPFGLGYYGVRHRSWKFFHVLRTGEDHLYDLAADPGEIHNLAVARPEVARRYRLEVARRHRLFDHLYRTERFVGQR